MLISLSAGHVHGPDLPDLLSIRLTQGRLPEKAGELLLPEHLFYNGGVSYEIGDTVTCRSGKESLRQMRRKNWDSIIRTLGKRRLWLRSQKKPLL